MHSVAADEILDVSNHPRHAAPTHNPVRLLAGIGEFRAPVLGALFTVVLVLGAAAFLAGAYAIVSLNVATQTVLTGSMRGSFDPGALVFTKPIPVKQVRPGDVIVFTPPGGGTPYTHRVVTVNHTTGLPVVTTKGDANRAPDAWKATLASSSVPVVIGHVPHLGRVLLAVQAQGVHTALVALLGLIVAVSGTRLILGSPQHRQQHSPRTA